MMLRRASDHDEWFVASLMIMPVVLKMGLSNGFECFVFQGATAIDPRGITLHRFYNAQSKSSREPRQKIASNHHPR
jgi:hypothetical protein